VKRSILTRTSPQSLCKREAASTLSPNFFCLALGLDSHFTIDCRKSERVFQFPSCMAQVVSYHLLTLILDWMDIKAAEKCAPLIENGSRVIRIAEAGHHLYSDNPDAFNKAFIAEVKGLDQVKDHAEIEYVF
jgi:hypothetical protein